MSVVRCQISDIRYHTKNKEKGKRQEQMSDVSKSISKRLKTKAKAAKAKIFLMHLRFKMVCTYCPLPAKCSLRNASLIKKQ